MTLNEFIAQTANRDDNIRLNEPFSSNDALVFLYASWSNSRAYLSLLLTLLSKTKFQDPVYLYDINLKSFNDFSKLFNVRSFGKGEIYMIKDMKVVDKIEVHPAANADKNMSRFINKYNHPGADSAAT